jgi:hypothetical protein
MTERIHRGYDRLGTVGSSKNGVRPRFSNSVPLEICVCLVLVLGTVPGYPIQEPLPGYPFKTRRTRGYLVVGQIQAIQSSICAFSLISKVLLQPKGL